MRSVIFYDWEVQATLAGRKTQFRRVIEYEFLPGFNPEWSGYVPVFEYRKFFLAGSNGEPATKKVSCPYHPGQTLWVRETWAPFCINKKTCRNNLLVHSGYCFKASPESVVYGCCDNLGCKWRSPVTMPREAARIFLKVNNVRAERLQDITEDDCFAEGINLDDIYSDRECGCPTPRDVYGFMWNSLNAKKGYPYAANPWVWAVEFERTEEVVK